MLLSPISYGCALGGIYENSKVMSRKVGIIIRSAPLLATTEVPLSSSKFIISVDG